MGICLVLFAATLKLVLNVCANKNFKGVKILQDNVCAVADENAVALFSKALYYVVLGNEDVNCRLVDLRGKGPAEMDVEARQSPFGNRRDVFLTESCFLGDLTDDLRIVIVKAQGVGKALTKLSSAATKLTADGYYLHNISLKGMIFIVKYCV